MVLYIFYNPGDGVTTSKETDGKIELLKLLWLTTQNIHCWQTISTSEAFTSLSLVLHLFCCTVKQLIIIIITSPKRKMGCTETLRTLSFLFQCATKLRGYLVFKPMTYLGMLTGSLVMSVVFQKFCFLSSLWATSTISPFQATLKHVKSFKNSINSTC